MVKRIPLPRKKTKVLYLPAIIMFAFLQSVELDRLAFYLDSDMSPWYINKRWEDLLPSEWDQVFISKVMYIVEHNLFSYPKSNFFGACTFLDF